MEKEYRKLYNDYALENIIIFRSGPHATQYIKGMDFADNAKALFEYMLEHEYNQKYELIWFVMNPDEFIQYNQYKNVSFVALDWSISEDVTKRDKYYRALCLAKYIFFTDAYGIALNARADQIRNASDYDDFYVASKEETKQQVENAEKIVEKVSNYIENLQN